MKIENIIIVARGKDVWGNVCVTYFEKDQPDLKRIKLVEDENDLVSIP